MNCEFCGGKATVKISWQPNDQLSREAAWVCHYHAGKLAADVNDLNPKIEEQK